MANFLTNLLFEPKGKHDPNKTYIIKDTVMSADASKVYFALQDVPAGVSLDNTDYWILQMDLSASKNAMDTAAANARTQTDAAIASANTRVEDMMGKAADAVTSVTDYAAKVGMRVKGETKITKGNPMTIYPDGGSLLKVQTDIPIKQLGEGDPYPAGCGKNLCPPIIEANNSIGGVIWKPKYDVSRNLIGYETTGTATGSTSITHYVFFEVPAGTYIVSGAPSGSVRGNGDIVVQNEDYEAIARAFDGSTIDTFTLAAPTKIRIVCQFSSGTVADGKIFKPMIRRASDPDSTYAPYSNIRPFIGYDKLNLNRAGKNLIPYYSFESGYTQNGITATINTDKSITLSGTPTADTWFYLSTYSASHDTGFKMPAGNYLISGCPSGGGSDKYTLGISVYRDGVYVDGATDSDQGAGGYARPIDGDRIEMYIRVRLRQTIDGLTFYPMLRLASIVDDTYEPYQNTTYTVQLGRTVYIGRFDWLTGKLVAEYGFVTLKGTETYTNTSTGIVTVISDAAAPIVGGVEAWCSHYKRTAATGVSGISDGEFTVSHKSISSTPRLYIRDSINCPDASAGQAYISAQYAAGTPVQIVYKLSTPIEMQLAPNVITATEDGGINHIYGDADLTVEWVKPLSSVNKRVESLLNEFSDEAEASGNPLVIKPVGAFPFDSIVTEFGPKRTGSGDPYPAGGGKNLAPIFANETKGGMTLTAYSDGSVSLTGTYTAGDAFSFRGEYETPLPPGTYTISVNNPEAITASGFWIAPYDDTITIIKSILMSEANTVYTLTTDVPIKQIRIRGSRDVALNNFIIKLQVEKGSDATEYAPPSNIRPLTGYDKLNLTEAGANLAPTHRVLAGDAGLTYSVSDGKLTITGTATRNVRLDTDNIILPPGQYTLAPNNSVPAPVALYMRKPDGTQFGSISMEKSTTAKHTFTLTETTEACASLYISSGAVLDVTVAIMLNAGARKEFEPYHGNIYTVQIGRTVYGGKMDWNTGILISDRALSTFNGTEAWTASNTNTTGKSRYFANNLVPGILAPPNTSTIAEGLVCSHYKAAPSTTNGTYQCVQSCGVYTSGTLYFYDDRYADKTADDWKAYVAAQYAAGTPIQVAYTLKTPIEIQLSTAYINTLSGTNTLYGDGDTITAKFRQSKIISLEERLSALEAVFLNQ